MCIGHMYLCYKHYCIFVILPGTNNLCDDKNYYYINRCEQP